MTYDNLVYAHIMPNVHLLMLISPMILHTKYPILFMHVHCMFSTFDLSLSLSQSFSRELFESF